ncbi:hypothetical protein Tsubulata_033273 [Turnera subulata]|uniref:DUF4005 domain-containing protein n=1 Tax=Turnera subulata TaxID=218843 RepID=A0A9Q0IW14_9ROSI|nr:hypothetical protein Tsubulata_033273 [Turnera subulata]
MGKAGRWMINFLLGKREDKEKKKLEASFYEMDVATPTATIPSTPNPYKRRWSFGKSSRKEKIHSGRKSVDSIINPFTSVVSSSLELEKKQKIARQLALQWTTTEAIRKTVVTTMHETDRKRKAVEDAAATRIQAAFRSHLAKKALKALRALVKLQALVRGHLVRKETNATLRQMQALMAIQVRARFQRIQMVEESHTVTKSQSSRHRSTLDASFYEAQGVSKNKYGYTNNLPMKRTKGITKFFSGELPILKPEHQFGFSYPTDQNSPFVHSPASKTIPGRASFTYEQPDYNHPAHNHYSFQPHYMGNTESSRAKVRSQSEPKQRPNERKQTKSNKANSMDGTNMQQDALSHCSSVHSTRVDHEEQDPWFTEIIRSRRPKDDNHDSKSTISSNHSNYNRFLVTYEVTYL